MITLVIILWILLQLSAPGWTYVLLFIGFFLKICLFVIEVLTKQN